MTNLFLSIIFIFSALISLIMICDTAIWFYNGSSSLFDVFGWVSGGILEYISNLVLGIWLLVSSYISFQSDYSPEKQWMNDVFLVLLGIQMIAKEVYYYFDGLADTYLNPIGIFFGIIMISTTLRVLLAKTEPN